MAVRHGMLGKDDIGVCTNQRTPKDRWKGGLVTDIRFSYPWSELSKQGAAGKGKRWAKGIKMDGCPAYPACPVSRSALPRSSEMKLPVSA